MAKRTPSVKQIHLFIHDLTSGAMFPSVQTAKSLADFDRVVDFYSFNANGRFIVQVDGLNKDSQVTVSRMVLSDGLIVDRPFNPKR